MTSRVVTGGTYICCVSTKTNKRNITNIISYLIHLIIIALASATGEKTPPSPLPVPNKAPLARAKEGPKAPTQAR